MDYFIKSTLVPLLLRLGLAAIFIFHGYHQVFDPGNEGGSNWGRDMKEKLGIEPPTATEQMAVAYGELVGGIAMAIGFLSRLAAIGLGAIMAGAIYTVHWKNGFSALQGGYEYNMAILVMCACVLLLGSGMISIDQLFFRRKRKPT